MVNSKRTVRIWIGLFAVNNIIRNSVLPSVFPKPLKRLMYALNTNIFTTDLDIIAPVSQSTDQQTNSNIVSTAINVRFH